jgi:hypothetical protein
MGDLPSALKWVSTRGARPMGEGWRPEALDADRAAFDASIRRHERPRPAWV